MARYTDGCRRFQRWLAVWAFGTAACGSQPSLAPPPAPADMSAAAPAADSATVSGPIVEAVAVAPEPPRPAPAPPPVKRIEPVDSVALEAMLTARLVHRPLAKVLARRTRNPAVAYRAATAMVREGRRLRVSPSLLAGVLLIENHALDSGAVSSEGAVGLMQVMPLHAGSYGCASTDLREVDANICHGARLLKLFLVRNRSVRVALKRYNGCVRGSVTPGCRRYPSRVLRTAASVRGEMLRRAAADGIVIRPRGHRPPPPAPAKRPDGGSAMLASGERAAEELRQRSQLSAVSDSASAELAAQLRNRARDTDSAVAKATPARRNPLVGR